MLPITIAFELPLPAYPPPQTMPLYICRQLYMGIMNSLKVTCTLLHFVVLTCTSTSYYLYLNQTPLKNSTNYPKVPSYLKIIKFDVLSAYMHGSLYEDAE